MKTTKLLLVIVLFSTCFSVLASSSPSAALLPFTIDISTGLDLNNSNAILVSGDQDANWMIDNAPANAPLPVVIDGPSWVISPNGAWNTYPGTAWVSAINTASNAVNNLNGNPYTFKRCFCVFEDGPVTLNFSVMADDWIQQIRMDNTVLTNTPQPLPGMTSQFTFAGETNVQQTINVTAGQHCLEMDVRNLGGNVMGLNVEGTIAGPNLLPSSCCTPINYICGFKFNDENGNSNWDAGAESGLNNWTIELTNQSTGVTTTTQTNNTGFYCFIGVAPGNYTVSEQNQPGWVQTFPTALTYSVNIPSNNIANYVEQDITFGNQQGTNISVNKELIYFKPDCCDEVIYELDICNTGALDANNVLLEDLLPDCLDYDDYIFLNCSTCTYNDVTGQIVIPFIPAGSCITLRISAFTDFTQECTNCVSLISLDETDTDSSDDSDCVGFDEVCDFDVDFNLVAYNTPLGYAYYNLHTNVTGGSGNYIYSWNTGSTSSSLYNLCNNLHSTYSVMITDMGVTPPCTEIAYFDFDTKFCKVASEDPIEDPIEYEEEEGEEYEDGPNKRSIAEQINTGISIYPNPTKHILNIDFDEMLSNTNIQILDISGRVLIYQDMDTNNALIDVSNLPPAIYVVKINIEGQESIFDKIVIIK